MNAENFLLYTVWKLTWLKVIKSPLKSFKSLKIEKILGVELTQYLEIFVQDPPPLFFTDSSEKLRSVSSSSINTSECQLLIPRNYIIIKSFEIKISTF